MESIFCDAKAKIEGRNGYPKMHGEVCFKQTKQGVIVTAKVYGLPTNKEKCKSNIFAFHIHDGTSCTGNKEDEFANAKSHYNPDSCGHPEHAGDMPPLFENNGYAYMKFLTNRFTVKEIIGKVVIIHDKPDNFTTQPSGNAGTKIACGKIK